MQCTKCQYNGKCNEACLSCTSKEQYNYKFNKYIIDGYDPKQESTEGSEKVTQFNDNIEDALRKVLYTLLDLSPNELLLIQALHNGKTLSEYAADMEKIAKKNEAFSRFRAFQTRKSILKKFPRFSQALLTIGQRKQLKKD